MRTTTIDDTISRTVEALMHYRGVSRDELCDATGLSTSSYYNRIKGSRAWTATEVAAVAHLLGVGIDVLYSGLDLGTVTREYQTVRSDYRLAA